MHIQNPRNTIRVFSSPDEDAYDEFPLLLTDGKSLVGDGTTHRAATDAPSVLVNVDGRSIRLLHVFDHEYDGHRVFHSVRYGAGYLVTSQIDSCDDLQTSEVSVRLESDVRANVAIRRLQEFGAAVHEETERLRWLLTTSRLVHENAKNEMAQARRAASKNDARC